MAAQWAKPNATNPGNMDPELVMAGKYATLALLTDPATDKEGKEEAPAAAADGTLDAYLCEQGLGAVCELLQCYMQQGCLEQSAALAGRRSAHDSNRLLPRPLWLWCRRKHASGE